MWVCWSTRSGKPFAFCSKEYSSEHFVEHVMIKLGRCLKGPSARLIHTPCAEQSWDDRITSLCRQGLYKEALESFSDLDRDASNLQLKTTAYVDLICACSHVKSLHYGRRVHRHIGQPEVRRDIVLQNHLINMYGKCGACKDARGVFDGMPYKNMVSWTSMIAGYSQNGENSSAMELYCLMRKLGFVPDQFTFGSSLKACSGFGDIKLGRQVHAHVVKSVFGCHLIALNALIAMYNKLDSIDEAYIVFCCTEEKDLISWGSMIAGFSQLHHEIEALEYFRDMLFEGIHRPNEFIFASLFSACGSIANAEYGRQIHVMCIKFGLTSNNFSGCALSDMYSKSGLMDSAVTAFHHIERPDVISWNALIGGYANKGNSDAAVSFFSRMRCARLVPDEITVRLLLCACTNPSSLYHGIQVHSYITKVGFNIDISVCNGLLSMYAKCLSLVDVFSVFEEISGHYDLVSWNTVLVACMQHNEPMEVFRLFKVLLNSAISPDYITITSIIGAYAVFASLEMGSQVHCYVMKTGLLLDTSVANGLMDMYIKCGSLEVAQKIFGYIENPDVVSWSCLIMGHAQFGLADEALQLFEEMKSLGLTPNEVTLISVLSACSHAGMVEKGWEVYRMMESEYGIIPTKEHCSCMIDLLARAGLLYEARDFINQMGYNPDIVVWKSLLAASRLQKSVEIGKWAAESILKLDPSHSSAHVLLSNIYASSGSWDDFARLRNLMKENNVQKIPGQSWIEIKNRIHAFLAEDSLHPERDKIYAVMDELWLQLIDHGYAAPNRRIELGEVSVA